MDGDIKLNGDTVIIEGRVIQAEATDLMLDNKDRRDKNSTTPLRRALVHDFNDGLTINFDRDYPGGVTVGGPVNIPSSSLTVPLANMGVVAAMKGAEDITCRARGIRIFNPNAGGASDSKVGPALSHAKNDTLALNEGKGYAGGVRVHGTLLVDDIVQVGTPGGGLGSSDFNFFDHIVTVIAKVAGLEAKVAALEAKVAKLEKKK